MLQYLEDRLSSSWRYLEATLFLTPAWGYFSGATLNFFNSKAVLIVVFLWFLDLITKVASILYNVAAKEEVEEKLNFTAAFRSFKKLFIWFFWLIIAFIFREEGASLVAYPIELAIVLIEGGSVIKNVCQVSDSAVIRSIGRAFETSMEKRAGESMTLSLPHNLGVGSFAESHPTEKQALPPCCNDCPDFPTCLGPQGCPKLNREKISSEVKSE